MKPKGKAAVELPHSEGGLCPRSGRGTGFQPVAPATGQANEEKRLRVRHPCHVRKEGGRW
jgi:hypothetical protein